MDHISEPSSRTIDESDRLDEGEIHEIVKSYEAELRQRTRGPQLEGLEGSQLAEVLRNKPENVFLLDISSEQGGVDRKWPLLVSTAHHQDYSQRFFAEHYPGRASYYVSLPPYEDIGALVSSSKSFEKAWQFLKDKNAILAFDYRESDDGKELTPALIQSMFIDADVTVEDVTPESRAWDMDYGLPLSLHYEGIARLTRAKDRPASTVAEAVTNLVASGEVKYLPENGVTILGRRELEANNGEILEQLWTIYSEQFDDLVEDHPVLGEQPRQEFESMLLDEETVNTVFMVDGKVAGLLYMVHDIEKCVWLNKEYYDKEFKDEAGWMTHFPGIVVAKGKARQGAGYAQQMMGTTLRIIAEMNKDLIVTFACSNVSSQYIPKMVERAVRDSPLYDFPVESDGIRVSAEYGYRILEVL